MSVLGEIKQNHLVGTERPPPNLGKLERLDISMCSATIFGELWWGLFYQLLKASS